MNSLVSWQLMLFLCATSFRETFEKVAPMENPLSTGQRLGSQALLAPWEQSPRCAERKPAGAQPNSRGASLCPPPESAAGPQRPGLCAPRSRLIPAPRGAVLVQREKDLSAYNWNSFGLRYGKRQTAPPGSVRGGRCAWLSSRRGMGTGA
ncbi:metastasis-suppressor KiSS-1 [Neofelis nebulosa]|uniref:metastasis-suppressor KiSS-1 n=1 Tax=Neofelis nebulosa TaxID=61452 RepID=UPI00272C3EAE|nr:metastasis-suppressor KiSS-1 [Neofelis nebulosa]